ncbi:MAG: 1-deoxy-D-xylulose-5-phosphate synthase [Symbiobacteriaceae bacterium]|nr:1-deoxy-D-xylulose-5-phosphate synthase [Symbiobacteriaceae bacterium]
MSNEEGSVDIYGEQAARGARIINRLKELGLGELQALATQLRQEIITTVAANGGHLASNLGVVELTIALHRAFHSPQDKIIWDVGHQCYVHKILTGRGGSFATLRQFQGMSGFPKSHESPHDIYETGHSSTSVSAALGMALARDLQGERHHVVAVLGDGALTGGLALEALNHVGDTQTRLIIILNDNDMSISANVGGLARSLNELRVQPNYFRTKTGVKNLLTMLPGGGEPVIDFIQQIKVSAKHFVLPGMIFEELGLAYLGPIDGHDLKALDFILKRAQEVTGPVLVHVVTRKGRGYLPAEEAPSRFHGVSAFDVATGEPRSKGSLSYTKVFADTLRDLAADHKEIAVITAAMPEGTGVSSFAAAYPERCFDVGIAEEHAVTLAAGLARGGMRPVVAIYSTFLQRAFDQIISDVALQRLPVVFAIDRAGLVGEDGATHHGSFDLSYLRLVPGLRIWAPSSYEELRAMLTLSLEENIPSAIRYPKGQGVSRDNSLSPNEIKQSQVLVPGEQLWLIAAGSMVEVAREASALLTAEGIQLGVVNLRIIKPLDETTLLPLLAQATHVVTLEENSIVGGVGAALQELARNAATAPRFLTLGLPDAFVEHGTREELLRELRLDPLGVATAIKEWLGTH